MSNQESTSKYTHCHSCQGALTSDQKVCPYCHAPQQTKCERCFDRFLKSVFHFSSPASKCLFILMVFYYIIIAADILLSPEYGMLDVLFHPPGDIIYRWGAHLRGDLVWWRLITANFVHIGIFHIFFNLYAMRYVSPYVERSYGAAFTFFSFVATGTGAMLCSNLFGAPGLVAGASGGLMGFIGLATISAHREQTALSIEVRNGMIKWALFVLGFGIVMNLTGTVGVDNIAHVSGFILGCLLGFILPKQSTIGFTHLLSLRLSRAAGILTFGTLCIAFATMAFASVSVKHQSSCITDIKLRAFDKAQIACEAAYKADKSQAISYHNYILINIINGHTDTALKLCKEGRARFKRSKQKLSFDELCRSIE